MLGRGESLNLRFFLAYLRTRNPPARASGIACCVTRIPRIHSAPVTN